MISTGIRSRVTAFMLVVWTCMLALFVAAGPAHAVTSSTTLQATVGPEFTITLMQDGAPVTSLEAGTYTIEVDDRSENHNFHLTGAGVEETTTVEEVAKKTWTVTFSEGTYTYVCDPHAQNMNGSFTVTAAGADAGGAQAGAQPEAPAGEELPFTGLDTAGIAWLSASLLAGGMALAFAAARRDPTRHGA